jgi:Autographiviridae endonuclease VII
MNNTVPRCHSPHYRNVHRQHVDGCALCEERRRYFKWYYDKIKNSADTREKRRQKWLKQKAGAPYPRSTKPKFCPWCQRTRDAREFATAQVKPDGLQSHCRECRATKLDKRVPKANRVLRKYGLTLQDYEARLTVCAVCGATEGLVLDHDHVTGAIRGTLCGGCNRGIGQMGDDPDRVYRAFLYLDGWRCVSSLEDDRSFEANGSSEEGAATR